MQTRPALPRSHSCSLQPQHGRLMDMGRRARSHRGEGRGEVRCQRQAGLPNARSQSASPSRKSKAGSNVEGQATFPAASPPAPPLLWSVALIHPLQPIHTLGLWMRTRGGWEVSEAVPAAISSPKRAKWKPGPCPRPWKEQHLGRRDKQEGRGAWPPPAWGGRETRPGQATGLQST